jgi:hypothetical protein
VFYVIPPFGGILFDLLRFGFLYPIFRLQKMLKKIIIFALDFS